MLGGGIPPTMTASRTFSLEDQRTFAELSGDANPMHVDPVAARRLLFGKPVVHGVHALLWGLDRWLNDRQGDEAVTLRGIDVAFQTAIGVGDEVTCTATSSDAETVELELATDLGKAARVRVKCTDGAESVNGRLPEHGAPLACREQTPDAIQSLQGVLPLYVNPRLLERLFPVLARRVSATQLAEILATTRLVGMVCPGLHSVYSGLSLELAGQSGATAELGYRVTKCDPRYSVVQMKVDGPTVSGSIKAFLRPQPRRQATLAELRKEVKPGEFASQRALVVGGSRGLGEITAKLLSAGGADVVITYHSGVTDARRVVSDIEAGGGSACCVPFDVCTVSSDALATVEGEPITHLYFFATPHIDGTKGGFSPALFQRFCDYYVTGFYRTVHRLQTRGWLPRGILYPSSVFVEDGSKNFAEYAAAKMAGETLCAYLEQAFPKLSVLRPRLPRVATDQTASLIPIKTEDSVPVMLRHLRELELRT